MRLLTDLFGKRTASFVTCRGRRRIGKSRLIQEFGKKAKTFLEFQGLPPREGIRNRDQLGAFADQLARQTALPRLELTSWPQAFSLLASVLRDEKTVVLLDEISWLAGSDRDFAGYLKIAWDTALKRFPKLILVACGSVSSWLDKNILSSTGFVGRESLELTLTELPLFHCNGFWRGKSARVAAAEKLKLLAVTGGVPRYLEEINTSLSAEENIRRMCFSREGALFSEFDRIFDDIFSKRAEAYRQIVETLVHGSRTLSEVCNALDRQRNGHVSEHLEDLVASGFVALDTTFSPFTGSPTRLARFRLRDNYLRFYLKYIEPRKTNILQGLTGTLDSESLGAWETIMGFQFENLVLNNIPAICQALGVSPSAVRSASPFFQRKTQRREACQIDLLIQTRYTLYVCEIRFRKRIGRRVIGEVQDRILKLKRPRTVTIRPVLVYEGELAPGVEDADFFDRCIHFGDLLTQPPPQ